MKGHQQFFLLFFILSIFWSLFIIFQCFENVWFLYFHFFIIITIISLVYSISYFFGNYKWFVVVVGLWFTLVSKLGICILFLSYNTKYKPRTFHFYQLVHVVFQHHLIRTLHLLIFQVDVQHQRSYMVHDNVFSDTPYSKCMIR